MRAKAWQHVKILLWGSLIWIDFAMHCSATRGRHTDYQYDLVQPFDRSLKGGKSGKGGPKTDDQAFQSSSQGFSVSSGSCRCEYPQERLYPNGRQLRFRRSSSYVDFDGVAVYPSDYFACRGVVYVCQGDFFYGPLWNYDCSSSGSGAPFRGSVMILPSEYPLCGCPAVSGTNGRFRNPVAGSTGYYQYNNNGNGFYFNVFNFRPGKKGKRERRRIATVWEDDAIIMKNPRLEYVFEVRAGKGQSKKAKGSSKSKTKKKSKAKSGNSKSKKISTNPTFAPFRCPPTVAPSAPTRSPRTPAPSPFEPMIPTRTPLLPNATLFPTPSTRPTKTPANKTFAPTSTKPSSLPSKAPTVAPYAPPTKSPTSSPSSASPILNNQTFSPTARPTANGTFSLPTVAPSSAPSVPNATINPVASLPPTLSIAPSDVPSVVPSVGPSRTAADLQGTNFPTAQIESFRASSPTTAPTARIATATVRPSSYPTVPLLPSLLPYCPEPIVFDQGESLVPSLRPSQNNIPSPTEVEGVTCRVRPPTSAPSLYPTLDFSNMNAMIACVAVIDDASGTNTSAVNHTWFAFRSRYPSRSFCLLQQLPNEKSGLLVPKAFDDDPKATYAPIQRDFGAGALASDWFQLCQLGSLRSTGVNRVAVFIDDWNHVTARQIRASYEFFLHDVTSQGIALVRAYENSEDNWLAPFLKDFH